MGYMISCHHIVFELAALRPDTHVLCVAGGMPVLSQQLGCAPCMAFGFT